MTHDLAANKQNAIDFYRTAYLGNPAKAVALYVGDKYIQHNPAVKDGKQGFIDYFTEMAEDYPEIPTPLNNCPIRIHPAGFEQGVGVQ
ncbi:hypothetical protein [Paraglaciecola chathamensis]|uniref:nuclear transport factor 2 family protein n=1 Tax=Paraglaciecola chathamensis TaxID=368405 RepID=UPI001E365AD4|nr:hypothetical protein [Paraglaciecola chathamensis]